MTPQNEHEAKFIEIRCYWDEGGKEHGLSLRDQLWLLEHALASEAAAYERAAKECDEWKKSGVGQWAPAADILAARIRALASPSGQPAPRPGDDLLELSERIVLGKSDALAALKAEVRLEEATWCRNIVIGCEKMHRPIEDAAEMLRDRVIKLRELAAPPAVTRAGEKK